MTQEWCTLRAYLNALGVELLIESIMDIMPKYDYECLREGVVAEFDLAIDHNAPFCETCGSVMRKVFTATPAIFKGRGWGSKP
jgi:predicted nucleic acid-binding Zn ribbon protein